MITLIAYTAASAWFLDLAWMLELNRFSAPERSAIVMVSLATLMLDVSIAILLRSLDTLRNGIEEKRQ